MGQTRLSEKQIGDASGVATDSEVSDSMFMHVDAVDPHPQYLTAADAVGVATLPDQTGHAGDMLLSDGTTADWGTTQLAHGTPNRTDSTLTYDSATRVVTLLQNNGFVYYYKGKKVVADVAISVQHSTAESNYYIYFNDTTGVLRATTTSWSMDNDVPICLIYYDGTKGIAWEERHGHLRNIALHKYLHATQGTKLVKGMVMSGYTLEDGSVDSSVRWSLTSGSVADEDITVNTSTITSGGPYTLFYRDSAIPSWIFNINAAPGVPYLFGTNIQYDNSGVLTDLTYGHYVNYWVYGATTLVAPHAFSIIGQVEHNTLDGALAETLTGMDLTNLPIKECVPIYKVTFKCEDEYTSTGKACIFYVEAIDNSYRKAKQPIQYLDLVATTEPAAPAINHLALYAQSRAGKLLPHWVDNNSVESAIQPALFGNNVVMWLSGTGNNLPISFGAAFAARNNGGGSGQTHPVLNSSNPVTQMKRASFSTGTSSTGASGTNTASTVAWRGNAAGLGGFFFFARFALETYAATERVLIGLSSNTADLVANPSKITNTICVGKDAEDNTLQIISVNESGGITKVDTGITPSITQVLDAIIFCKPNDTKVTVRIIDVITGTILVNNITVSTNLPSNTFFMYMQSLIQSTTGSVPKVLSLNRMYLETPT